MGWKILQNSPLTVQNATFKSCTTERQQSKSIWQRQRRQRKVENGWSGGGSDAPPLLCGCWNRPAAAWLLSDPTLEDVLGGRTRWWTVSTCSARWAGFPHLSGYSPFKRSSFQDSVTELKQQLNWIILYCILFNLKKEQTKKTKPCSGYIFIR